MSDGIHEVQKDSNGENTKDHEHFQQEMVNVRKQSVKNRRAASGGALGKSGVGVGGQNPFFNYVTQDSILPTARLAILDTLISQVDFLERAAAMKVELETTVTLAKQLLEMEKPNKDTDIQGIDGDYQLLQEVLKQVEELIS